MTNPISPDTLIHVEGFRSLLRLIFVTVGFLGLLNSGFFVTYLILRNHLFPINLFQSQLMLASLVFSIVLMIIGILGEKLKEILEGISKWKKILFLPVFWILFFMAGYAWIITNIFTMANDPQFVYITSLRVNYPKIEVAVFRWRPGSESFMYSLGLSYYDRDGIQKWLDVPNYEWPRVVTIGFTETKVISFEPDLSGFDQQLLLDGVRMEFRLEKELGETAGGISDASAGGTALYSPGTSYAQGICELTFIYRDNP